MSINLENYFNPEDLNEKLAQPYAEINNYESLVKAYAAKTPNVDQSLSQLQDIQLFNQLTTIRQLPATYYHYLCKVNKHMTQNMKKRQIATMQHQANQKFVNQIATQLKLKLSTQRIKLNRRINHKYFHIGNISINQSISWDDNGDLLWYVNHPYINNLTNQCSMHLDRAYQPVDKTIKWYRKQLQYWEAQQPHIRSEKVSSLHYHLVFLFEIEMMEKWRDYLLDLVIKTYFQNQIITHQPAQNVIHNPKFYQSTMQDQIDAIANKYKPTSNQ